MGEMAQAMVRFAQPLIDRTDGSLEQIQKAFSIAMLCWNMAILPDAQHDEYLQHMRKAFRMSDDEFQEFRRDVIEPMVRRHRELFPGLAPTQPRRWIYNT